MRIIYSYTVSKPVQPAAKPSTAQFRSQVQELTPLALAPDLARLLRDRRRIAQRVKQRRKQEAQVERRKPRHTQSMQRIQELAKRAEREVLARQRALQQRGERRRWRVRAFLVATVVLRPRRGDSAKRCSNGAGRTGWRIQERNST